MPEYSSAVIHRVSIASIENSCLCLLDSSSTLKADLTLVQFEKSLLVIYNNKKYGLFILTAGNQGVWNLKRGDTGACDELVFYPLNCPFLVF